MTFAIGFITGVVAFAVGLILAAAAVCINQTRIERNEPWRVD